MSCSICPKATNYCCYAGMKDLSDGYAVGSAFEALFTSGTGEVLVWIDKARYDYRILRIYYNEVG